MTTEDQGSPTKEHAFFFPYTTARENYALLSCWVTREQVNRLNTRRTQRPRKPTTETHEMTASPAKLVEPVHSGEEATPNSTRETSVLTTETTPELGDEEEDDGKWVPPSLPGHSHSYTYHTPIPAALLANPEDGVRLGVDEAGRGPVLGPMVYGVSYCLASYEPELKKYGFADSKTLSEDKRTHLLEQMSHGGSELFENVGWATRSMSALDISAGMLRSRAAGNYNLNEQAHDATMDLIQGVIDLGVNLKEVFVDTVGPPVSYKAKLQKRFPTLMITVEKKADALFPVVSAASICAKVTRDFSLLASKVELYSSEVQWGSGYPSDPKTKTWLNQSVDKIFGWSQVVRFSWGTAKEALIKSEAIDMEWEEDNEKVDYGDVTGMFAQKKQGLDSLPVSSLWYGKNGNFF